MDTENPNAPTPAQSRLRRKNHPDGHRTAGVVHDHVRHTENCTVPCEGCDLAFRAPTPGRCRDCRTGLPEAA
ncbi:hypothetical protein [Streptomyces griseosporeus]|uniref:hypothetical protein n=1 Tax=Streptomyces griseosporeus TaxID=1910 RepID=UPI0037014B01